MFFRQGKPLPSEFFPEGAKPPVQKQEEISERREDAEDTLLLFMKDRFSEGTVPGEIIENFDRIESSILHLASDKKFVDDEKDAEYQQMLDRFRNEAMYLWLAKESPSSVNIEEKPEEGLIVRYTDGEGKKHERRLSQEEEDWLFNVDMYGEALKDYGNAKAFTKFLTEKMKDLKIDSEKQPKEEEAEKLIDEMFTVYKNFGFTREQVKELILIADTGDIPYLESAGVYPDLQKIQLIKEIFERYLNPEERTKFLKLAFALGGTGMIEGYLTPQMMSKAFAGSGDMKETLLYGLGTVGLTVGMGWLRRSLHLSLEKFINEIMERGLNQQLARDISSLPGEKISGESSMRTMQTAERSINSLRSLLKDIALSSMPSVGRVITGAIQILAQSTALGAATIGSAPISWLMYRYGGKKRQEMLGKTYQMEEEIGKEFMQQLNAHLETVLLGNRELMSERLLSLIQRGNLLSHDMTAAEEKMHYFNEVIHQGTAVTIAIIAKMLEQSGVRVPEKVMNAVITSQILGNSLSEIMCTNYRLIGDVKAIIEMEEFFNGYADREMKEDEKRKGASELPHMGISLRDLEMKYNGRTLLNKLNLDIAPGDFVNIQGLNGSGKSTLFKLLTGYYRPTSGEITLGDEPVGNIKKSGDDSLYAKVGYLSQSPYILSGSVAENLSFGSPDASEKDMYAILKEVGLERVIRESGKDISHLHPDSFSGGEKRRLAIARLLLKMRSQETGMILMDEPTNDLDAKGKDLLVKLIQEERQKRPGKTFLVISHDKAFLEALSETSDKQAVAVRTIELRDGSVLES
jgi:ABC-type transport system involved in cytochrome bd biosynthesis fused ATPase/permease subunit